MELALHYLVHGAGAGDPRPEGRPDERVFDLVLLDTATGLRRRLVSGIAWETPRWSADGRRVRFEQQPPDLGFVWREIDLRTGDVEDVENDAPDGSALPRFSDRAVLSPGGRWIAYRDLNLHLCVARAGGPDAFMLSDDADEAFWSPCGTKLAANLTVDGVPGAYVVDLRSGEHRRVSPDQDETHRPDYHVNGWSPDGAWVVVTKNRWHDRRTYDYEWDEVWLLAADGTAARQLTEDGRCRAGAIRPTGEPPPENGEHELTFEWARRLRSADDPPAAGEALAAQVRLDPETGPPFPILLMVRTAEGLVFPAIADCESIPDGFGKLDAFLAANDYRPADAFTVVFPRYSSDDLDEELSILRLAHLVLDETRARDWQFDRDLPDADLLGP